MDLSLYYMKKKGEAGGGVSPLFASLVNVDGRSDWLLLFPFFLQIFHL